jgi:hypothetical protein
MLPPYKQTEYTSTSTNPRTAAPLPKGEKDWRVILAEELVEANSDWGITYNNQPNVEETLAIIRKHEGRGDSFDSCLVCERVIPPGPDFCGLECEIRWDEIKEARRVFEKRK